MTNADNNKWKRIEDKLYLWAEYIAQGQDGGHGSSSCVPWAKLMIRPHEFRSRTLLPVSYDEYNEVNQRVGKLPEVLKRVVYLEWLHNGSREIKAKREGITEKTFRGRLYIAYAELDRAGL